MELIVLLHSPEHTTGAQHAVNLPARLAQRPQDLVERTAPDPIEPEPPDSFIEHVCDQCEDRPPVPRSSRGRARFGDRIPVAEEHLIHGLDDALGRLIPRNLTKSLHAACPHGLIRLARVYSSVTMKVPRAEGSRWKRAAPDTPPCVSRRTARYAERGRSLSSPRARWM